MLRRQPAFRVMVALFACAIAAAPLLSTAHLIAVRHATCDHGESIEIVELDGEVHRHAAACIRQGADARAHEHDHCSIASKRHARPFDHLAAPTVRVIAESLSRTPAEPLGRAQIPILRLAPKSSPPT